MFTREETFIILIFGIIINIIPLILSGEWE
jgi:hypothetical protein